ncbi:MAG TPA: Ig-like domain-containing protein [Thermoanaerobaculia bacterium]
MRKFAGPLLFVLSLLSLPSPILAQCGVERWSVKTGTDADVGLVNLSSSTAQTIVTMRGWTAPNPIPANNRVSPYETTQWVLNATLTQYKLEGDSDYHVVLSDASGNTLIAEIPSPSCVGAGSPFGPGITNARNQFDARFTATTSFQTANIPVQIRGVGMFDFLHGQTGVAPNGIEIHPVLNIVFNPTAADFTIAAAPSVLSVVQGTSSTSTISTSISGSFNSAVSLSASGLPTGASASFSPSSIAAPGSGSSTATITTSASTPVGTYTVTVTGSGGGTTHTATITLTVTAASTPDFSISDSPPSLSVVQGASGSSTVTTAISGGFNAAVALTASGLPTGATATFSPSSIAAPGSGSSTATIATSASTPAGSYTVTITGTGGGKTHATSLALTVTSPGGGGTEAIVDGGFESATVTGNSAPGWTGTTNISGDSTIAFHGTYPHGGTNYAALGASNNEIDTMTQTLSIPSTVTAASLTFWANVVTSETANTGPYDFCYVEIHNSSGTLLATPLTLDNNSSSLSNNTAGTYFKPAAVDLTSYKGQTIQLVFHVTTDSSLATTFRLDDVSVALTTGGGDTTPPATSVTAPANGATVSSTVSVTATASDNIAVTKMEIYVDGTLQTSNTNATSLTFSWNTTTFANGSHTIVSKAYDAAGNVGTSSTITVTVSNGGSQQLLGNPGFETGTATPWVAATGVVTNSTSEAAHGGTWKGWLDGYGTAHTDTLYQQVAIPSTITTATLTFWLHIDTAETSTTTAYDTLNVQVRNSSGTVLATLATYSNLNATTGYVQKTFDLSAYKGQTVQIYLVGVEDSTLQTSFVVDDFALNVQ